MQLLRTLLSAVLLLTFTWTVAWGQEIDKDLIIGKWKFSKATIGLYQRDYQYNGTPILTFGKNGNWITEDTNPNYRQRGSWKIENNLLVRDPEISGMREGDIPPYPRVIEKLTNKELVFYAADKGNRTFTFYFTRVE